jgi:2-methylisocitrate lyase-like PEP mutase family enzyme
MMMPAAREWKPAGASGRLRRARRDARGTRGLPRAFVSGYALSATRLARPDVGLLRDGGLDAARRICAAVDVPVIVDADTGYGGAANVERTIRELVQGAAVLLEDQVWPKRCGHMEDKQVVPLGALELAAASGARRVPSPRAPTRARRSGSTRPPPRARVRQRAPTRSSSGAALRGRDGRDPRRAAAQVRWWPTWSRKTPRRTVAECAAAGFHIVVLPIAGPLAATHALGDVCGHRARRVQPRPAGRMLEFDAMNALLGLRR